MNPTQTVTETMTVTNTHLAIAVGLTLAIGGFALASVPMKSMAPKCGVNKQQSVQVLKCRSGQYSGMNYTCYDGSKQQYRPGKCVSAGVMQAYAKNVACKNRCNVPPQAKKISSSVQPVPKTPVDTGYGYGYNPIPSGYGYGYNATLNNGVILPDLRIQDVSFNNDARTVTIIVQNSGNGASDAIGRINPNSASEGLVIHPQNQEGRNINSDSSDLPALQSGATTTISFPYPPHDLMRSLQVRLDNRNVVVESNEENNITVYPMPNPIQ